MLRPNVIAVARLGPSPHAPAADSASEAWPPGKSGASTGHAPLQWEAGVGEATPAAGTCRDVAFEPAAGEQPG